MAAASTNIGVSYTAMIKASQYIGQNNHRDLTVLAYKTWILNMCSLHGLFLLLWIFSDKVFAFYTSDPIVVEHLYTIMLPYFIMNNLDGLQFMASQMYKALQMGSWVCLVFAGSYYGAGCGFMIITSHFF
jgi:Na+-driven multidrug efflux pump